MKKRYEIIEQQIERLKQKGLQFKDEEKARSMLLRENHYYITEGYEDIFVDLKNSTRTNEVYEEETYFEELYALYKFDRDLKGLIFDYINIIETNIKSYVSYVFSSKYGDKDYIKRENFNLETKYDQEFEKMNEQIENNKKRYFNIPKNDIKRFFQENNYIPLWMLVKTFSFGTIVNFYNLMKIEEKQEVAQGFNISPYSLQDYLKMLNIVRNICAHGGILFNVRTYLKLKIKDCKYHSKLKIKEVNNKYELGINDLFAIMIILKKLLQEREFSEMFIKIEKMLEELKSEVDSLSYQNLLKSMGFPENYGELIEF